MESVRVYELPKCKMVTSQCGMFGEKELEEFNNWFSSLPRPIFPKDFLWYDESRGGFVWYYLYDEGLEVPESFQLVDFPGGLYAVCSGVDGQDNADVMQAVKEFIQVNEGFTEDFKRQHLGNIITSPAATQIMGYTQMDYYIPIKKKEEHHAF